MNPLLSSLFKKLSFISGFFACKWGNYLKNRVRWIWRELFRSAHKWKPRYANSRYAGTRCNSNWKKILGFRNLQEKLENILTAEQNITTSRNLLLIFTFDRESTWKLHLFRFVICSTYYVLHVSGILFEFKKAKCGLNL